MMNFLYTSLIITYIIINIKYFEKFYFKPLSQEHVITYDKNYWFSAVCFIRIFFCSVFVRLFVLFCRAKSSYVEWLDI